MPLDLKRKPDCIQNKTEDSIEKKNTKSNICFSTTNPQYSFDRIVLNSRQIKDIEDVIAYDKYRDYMMNNWGMKQLFPDRNGLAVNLYGASGTGKTMVAHAIADKLSKRIVIVNYAEIESKYVGETSKNLVSLFDFAQKEDALLLFDEADALLSRRVTNMSTSADVSVNQTKSVLLNVLNEYNGYVIFTTNYISNYDAAFLRRIPFQIKFDLPDEQQRASIWKKYMSTGIPYEFNIEQIAHKYEGLSGSDIANSVWIAALESLTKRKLMIGEEEIEYAIKRIIEAKNENRGIEKDFKIVSARDVEEDYAMRQIERRNG